MKQKRIWSTVLVVVLIVAGVAAFGYWYYLARDVPTEYAAEPDHFKYGSFGAEFEGGIPLLVWQAMPDICSDLLPASEGETKDYSSLGFIYEEGMATPVGAPVRTVGMPRVGLNCATCHVGTVRADASGDEQLVIGMPAHELDLSGYLRFMGACAKSDNYTPDNVMASIQANNDISFVDGLVYRYLVIPATQKALIEQRELFSFMDVRPDTGPGRVDTLGPYKVLYGLMDDSVGTADFMSIWNQAPRADHWGNWDGNNDNASERNKGAALGAGPTEDTLDIPRLERMEAFIHTLPPPPYPFEIDEDLVAAGAPIYAEHCAACHDFDGEYAGDITEIDEIGTDRNRFDSQTAELAANVNTIGEGKEWAFDHFRKSTGYLNTPLDGIWARAPYLHNGSVPSMADLLEAPENRTAVFYRGYNVYDPEMLGFVSTGPEAEAAGFMYDTSVRGNGNAGHLYGTDLSAEEKAALIEYMKTY